MYYLVCLSVCPPFFSPSVCVSLLLFVCLSLSICVCLCLSSFFSVCPYFLLLVCLSSAPLSVRLPASLALSPNVILGVTNPFFIKTFQSWPHIVRLGDPRMAGDLPKQVKVKKLAKLKTLDTKPGRVWATLLLMYKWANPRFLSHNTNPYRGSG